MKLNVDFLGDFMELLICNVVESFIIGTIFLSVNAASGKLHLLNETQFYNAYD